MPRLIAFSIGASLFVVPAAVAQSALSFNSGISTADTDVAVDGTANSTGTPSLPAARGIGHPVSGRHRLKIKGLNVEVGRG